MYKPVATFIRELFKTEEAFIPLHEPRFVGNEKKYVNDAIDSTFVSSVGAYVDQFEEMMKKATGAKHAVAVVNGTSALHISLLLAGVKQNDEVITQAVSFVATCNAIAYQKGIPHFVDVEMDSLGMSPGALSARLAAVTEIKNGQCYNKETGRRIAACVPMHTFGHACRIDEIIAICDQYHIPVVEDAAESIGSYYKEQHTGTFGLMGTFSFNGNKTITCGGGGAIVTNDEAIAKKAKHLTTTAKVPHRWDYEHDHVGYNYRMPNLNAAMACAQLEMLPSFVENKRETAKKYESFFGQINGISFLTEPKNSKSNYWLNAVILKNKEQKDLFLETMNEGGVMTRPLWILLHHLEMYQGCPTGELPHSEQLFDTVVNIPSSVRV